jgi:ABC-type phosphate transport system substrate-binding protein
MNYYNSFCDMPQGDIALVVANYSDPRVEGPLTRARWGSLARNDPSVFGAAYARSNGSLLQTLQLLVPASRVLAIDPSASSVAAANQHNRSLAFALQWELTSAASSTVSSLYTVSMTNTAGTLFSGPTPSSLHEALQVYQSEVNLASSSGMVLDIGLVDSLTAWPLAGLAYVSVPDDAPLSSCSYTTSLLEFMAWMATDSQAAALVDSTTAMASLTSAVRQKVSEAIGLVRCGGSPALTTRYFLGSGARATLWYQWSVMYDPTAATVDVSFSQAADATAYQSLTSLDVDFAGVFVADTVDTNITSTSTSSTGTQGASDSDVRFVPVGLRPVACSANTGSTERLTLTIDALAGILLGNITKWDDPLLGAPASYGSGDIRVVLDQRGSPVLSGGPRGGISNQALYAMLVAMRPALVDGVVLPTGILKWPVLLRNTTLYGNDNVALAVASTANAFGCDFLDLLLYQHTLSIADMVEGYTSGGDAKSVRDSASDAAQVASAIAVTLAHVGNVSSAGSSQLSFVTDTTDCQGC